MGLPTRRSLALIGALAWIAFAIGGAAHLATDAAPSDGTHDGSDCPVCQTAGRFAAVQSELPDAVAAPPLPCGSGTPGRVPPRNVAYRPELARGPPASLIT